MGLPHALDLSVQAPEHLVFDHQRCFADRRLKQHRATPLKLRCKAGRPEGTYSVDFLDLSYSKFSSSNVIAIAGQKSRQSRRQPHEARGAESIPTSRMT